MTNISRVRVEMNGFPGGPGLMTFYFLDTTTALPSISTYLTSIAPLFPLDVHFLIPPTGDVIEDTTGALTGEWSAEAEAIINGSSDNPYAAPVGAVVNWHTNTILDGHRVRGRSFLVPLSRLYFEADGSLTPGVMATITTAASEFVIEQSASFVIWHRPFAGTPAVGTKPARAAHAGGHGLVTAASCPDLAAVLRSRRD